MLISNNTITVLNAVLALVVVILVVAQHLKIVLELMGIVAV